MIGGVVYRGEAIPGLVGTYVYADYGSGRLYGLQYDPVSGEPEVETLLEMGLSIVHFAESSAGEVFLLDHNRGVFRIEAADTTPVVVDPLPQTLSETGCVDPANPRQALPMLIPYQVAHGFWSDQAEKRRWFAIPDGTQIEVREDGQFDLPIGSVTVKEFVVGGEPVETRLSVRHEDGYWAGYTYLWSGEDAYLADARATVTGGGGIPWEVPSRPECLKCHTNAWGGLLGMSVAQLDTLQVYPNGAIDNQLDVLRNIGMLVPSEDAEGPFPALADTTVPVAQRARTYLHVNCAFCHFPGGTGGGDLDLRVDTSLSESGLCAEPSQGDLGLPNARIVAPGAPERSVLIQRLQIRGEGQMPPLASNVVDEVGVSVMREWVTSLEACEE